MLRARSCKILPCGRRVEADGIQIHHFTGGGRLPRSPLGTASDGMAEGLWIGVGRIRSRLSLKTSFGSPVALSADLPTMTREQPPI